MGLGGSKEVEENVRAEKEAELKRQSQRRQAEERKVKDEALKKFNEEALKNKREADQEVEEESQKNLEITKKVVADYNQQKENGEKRLEEIKKKMKENVEKEQEMIKSKGVDDVKEGMERIQKDNEQLVREKELLTRKMNELYVFKQENVKKEKEEEEEMRKEEMVKKKEHADEILELTKMVADVELEGQERLTELVGEQAEFQKGILGEKEKLYQIQMSDALSLRNSQDIEQRHEIFRRNCKDLIHTHSGFSKNFGSEEPNLIGTRDEINQGIDVLMAPELSLTLRTLRRLSSALQEFSVDGSTEPEKFEDLREVVLGLVADLSTGIGTIVSNIQSYQDALQNRSSESEEPSRSTSRTQSESEEFEVLTSGIKEKVVQKPDESASKRFNISELYVETKELIKQLSKEMLKFNVRACTAFDDQLAIQHIKATERLRIAEGRPAIESQRQSQPAIQESDESDK